MRVPTLVISPWIPRNVIDHRHYEHASIPKTLEDRFGLPSLTERDKRARSLRDLLVLEKARENCLNTLPVLSAPASDRARCSFDNSFVRELKHAFMLSKGLRHNVTRCRGSE